MFVADMLEPVDILPIQRFLNGDVRHRRRCGHSMPVLLARRKPHNVTSANLLNRTAFALNPS
jgi:hypothetical protein